MIDFKLDVTYTKIINSETVTKNTYFVSQGETKEEAITLAQSNIDNFINRVGGTLISIT